MEEQVSQLKGLSVSALLSSSPDRLNNPITANKLVPVADVKWGSQARALGCFFRGYIAVGQVLVITIRANTVGIVCRYLLYKWFYFVF